MDDRGFDQFARALGGASTRRSALAALAGLLAGGAVHEVDAKRGRADRRRNRRSRCEPACAAGQTCVKGACTCGNGGTSCGGACCAPGQRCRDGACADPLPACLAFGATCKDTGRPCCDGLTCGSGQGGKGDIACYKPAGAACDRTDECVFSAECVDGACIDRQQIGPEWPDESCEPNVAPGDTAGLLRALREEGEARLAPGEYVFALGEGETAIEMPEGGGRIIGCRGSAALEGRQGRDGDFLQNWSVVCRGKAGATEWTCVRISNPVHGYWGFPSFWMVRVQITGRGSSGSTRSVGIVDERIQDHNVYLRAVTISCFNRGLVQADYSLAEFVPNVVAFCRNLDGTCFVRSRATLWPVPLVPACQTPVDTCSCGQSGPCTPNVIANDTADLLAKVAAGDAILPPNSTYAFTITASQQAAIDIPAGLSTKIRACPGTDRSTVNITCTEAQSQNPIFNWQCIKYQGASLLVENVTITGGNPEDASSTGIFTTTAGSTLPGPLALENTKITGFGSGLYNTGFATLSCADNAICGNTALNCRQPGGGGDIAASCSGCAAGTGSCPP